VRNGEEHLASWLASVGRFADSVIALDDGSTDRTREILEESAIVRTVLTNPVRDSYLGWDDRENRQRLVDAAVDAGTGWALFLDADERIDEADGRTFQSFLRTDARKGFAYGFELFSMVGDEHHRNPRALWVIRLFHCDDALQPLPSRRLHFVPVPANIDREHWLYTSLRIQHFGGSSAERRVERRAKYAEVDPDDEYDQEYDKILLEPQKVEPWPPRRDVPVVLGRWGRRADLVHARSTSEPVAITAVVIAQNDGETIERSISALVDQEVSDPFEVILVDSGTDDTVPRIRERFPSVRCVQLPDPALPGEARNAGLLMARGEFISFPGSHVWLTEGSLQARLEAHDEGWSMVTGLVRNGNTSRAGWASYLLDHAARMSGRPSGEIHGPPGSASYLTEDVRRLGGFPEAMRAGEDTVVNEALCRAGRSVYLRAEASFFHASPCRSLRDVARHHYKRGRGLGQILAAESGGRLAIRHRLRRTVDVSLNRIRRLGDHVAAGDPEMMDRYRSVRWMVRAGAVAYFIGGLRELGRSGVEVDGAPTPVRSVEVSAEAPLLTIGGRPGRSGIGMLSMGGAVQGANRLATMMRYAQHSTPVHGALAPIVVSATATTERPGTYTLSMGHGQVESYLAAARGIGAGLLLQIQPGGAHLRDLAEQWAEMVAHTDVAILFDLREHLAYLGQAQEIPEVLVYLRDYLAGSNPPFDRLYVRGLDDDDSPASVVEIEGVDLREVGSAFPHDLLAARPGLRAVIYD
jgi:glycosyltransferase involved in cell wall biosynthesis